MRDHIVPMTAGEGLVAGPFTADATRAVESAWPMFVPLLQRLATHKTEDPDVAKDLVQEAMIQLWRSDPTRFDLADPYEYRYLRRTLVNRMWRVWDRETDRLLDVALRFP